MSRAGIWGFAAAAIAVCQMAPAAAANIPVVVIDAGHGGHDPGAISVQEDQPEKDATLAVARLVRDELNASGRIKVVLTRDSDRFLPLVTRRQIAERQQASLFISLHADSAPNVSARGASVYTLSETGTQAVSSRFGRRVSGLIGGGVDPDIAALLGDLGQRGAVNSAGAFAERLEAAFGSRIRKRNRFHLPAEFAVLKAIGIPAVLVEMGYVTSAEDAAELFSPSGQKQIAKAVSRAVLDQLTASEAPQLASAE